MPRWLKYLLIAAVVALGLWIGSHLQFTDTKVPIPLKGEALRNPYYAAIRFTEQLHAKASWERIFSVPATDSVVLLSNWNWSLAGRRREQLEKWVADGGRLVVDDSLVGGGDEFEKWAGVTRVNRQHDVDKNAPKDGDDEADDAGDEPESQADREKRQKEQQEQQEQEKRRRRLSGRQRDLIDQFIQQPCTEVVEDGTNRALSVCGIDRAWSLTSSRKLQWALRDGKRIEALRVAVGRGSITVLNVSPFRYRDFFHGDHPDLFVAATQLHHGDDVLFFTEGEHASLLALTWHYGAPAVLLLAALIVLALWRNTARFGPLAAVPEKARRSLAEQIRGTGEFTLRYGGGSALHGAMVRAVREAAVRRLPGYDRMSAEDRIAALAKLTGVLASELGPAINSSGARSPHELRNVIAVLETARRRLIVKKTRVRGQENGN